MKRAVVMLGILVLLFGRARQANADLVTSIPNGMVVPMTGNYGGPGPLSFGPGTPRRCERGSYAPRNGYKPLPHAERALAC